MSWKKEKKQTPSDLEKGSDISSISSFGSPKKAIVALPPQAHVPPSPNSDIHFTQSGTTEHSSQFISSFPTSDGHSSSRSAQRRAWIRRHAFVILIAIILVFALLGVVVLLLMKNLAGRYTADVAPGSGLGNAAISSLLDPTPTPAAITSASLS
ncbi:hypothetical protein FRC17_007627 [Serendipita sp. 399]|nr:hypothetical protein FRC17_007627 [Serendipita sp. 399]